MNFPTLIGLTADGHSRVPPIGVRSRRTAFAWQSRESSRLVLLVGVLAVLLVWHTDARAQAAPSLVTMVNTLKANGVFQFDALEFDAAAANDAAYGNLLKICAPTPTRAGGTCTGSTLLIFNRLRELEDNAVQLLGGNGETQYSLRLNPEELGDALRWTAPEEYAAQGSLATRFANSQAQVLNNRFAALRFAAQTNRVAQNYGDGNDDLFGASQGALGGSAGADPGELSFGRLSIFANGSFGTGVKDPTTFEDAFAFDDTEGSVGVDYRLSDKWVIGIMAGHTEKRVDFNSELSIVAGRIRGNGQSGLLYAQFELGDFYVNGTVGAEHLSLDSVRRITYPSNNPDIASVNTTSFSDTGANTLTATLATGYSAHYRAFSATPYLNGQYTKVRIAAFTEHSSEGFAFNVGEQDFHSLELTGGLKLQYVVSTPLGVIVPYVYGEYWHEFSDTSRTIQSTYAAGDSPAPDMVLPTDPAASHYYLVGGGGSVVMPHGLQGFIQYVRVLDYANYTDHVISGGVRLEF